MADWDTNNPGDSDIVSTFPANERAARAAAKSVFGVDHHEEDDADQGQHDRVTMPAQGSDPATDGGAGILYTKEVSGTVEAFFLDSDGNVRQLTQGGYLSADPLRLPTTSTPTALAGGGFVYTRTYDSGQELFYMDAAGNETRMTYQGEIALNLQNTDVVVGSIRTHSFQRGHVTDITVVDGDAELDFEAGTVFRYTNTEAHTLTFANLPDDSQNEEQTIYIVMSDGGNFAIELDIAEGWSFVIPGEDDLILTVDGLDILVCSIYANQTMVIVPVKALTEELGT